MNRSGPEARSAVAPADWPRLTIVGSGGCGLHGGGSRWAPERIEDVARAIAVERVAERGDEIVVLVEPQGCVCAKRRRAVEPGLAPAGRDDPGRTKELRRLHRNQSDGAGRAEHEHRLAALERRPPGERQPASQPRDAERRGKGGIGTLGNLDRVRIADRGALRDCAVRGAAERSAEDPDQTAVRCPTHGLATRDVRELGVARGEDAARDGEVDRVERRRDNLDDLAARLGDLADLG